MITQSLNSSVFSLSLVAVARAASHTKIKDDLITFISAFLTSRPGQVMLDHKAWSLPAPSKARCPLSLQELITVTYGHDAISLLALWELRVGLSLQNPHYVWLVVISSNVLPPWGRIMAVHGVWDSSSVCLVVKDSLLVGIYGGSFNEVGTKLPSAMNSRQAQTHFHRFLCSERHNFLSHPQSSLYLLQTIASHKCSFTLCLLDADWPCAKGE